MNQDFDDDEDLHLLSESSLPLISTSYTNNTFIRNNNRRQCSIRSQKNISSNNQILHEDDTSLLTQANTGDIIRLKDGTRKKYNGSSWRRMCSKINCSYYSQSEGLCKLHLNELKTRNLSMNNNTKIHNDNDILLTNKILSKQNEPKKGHIITLLNGIRKIYDGRHYRRICANPICTIIVHGSHEYQNGLCPNHYHEFHAKNLLELKSSQNTLSIPSNSIVSSSLRKRRRLNSPSSMIPSQVPMTSNIQISISKPNHRLSIAAIPPSVDINNPRKGDIIEMENGSRKKFDGVVWRKICSLPGCLIAAQRDELCRKHFIKLNGKPNNGSNNDINESVTMVTPLSKSISSVSTSSSTDEKSESRTSKKLKNEFMDCDNEQEEQNNDNASNSYHALDDNNDIDINQENSSIIQEDNFDTPIDHTLIDALSASRQKFLTDYLKKWLREHHTHPYPSNQEKIELAKQSSITYDQVTTWFNNARAILRRRHAKLQHSYDTVDNDDDDNDELSHENKNCLDSNHKISSQIQQSLSLFSGLCYRSIGVQCNPSTVNQTTTTTTTTTSTSTNLSMMTDDELISDRTIRIIRPSNHILKTINSIKHNNTSQEFIKNDIKNEDDEQFRKDQEIILTSTCLDDDQMTRLKEFCSRFNIKLSNIVDEFTTHLITDEDDETLVCPLSKKVIQAVAHHMYIVTYRWIDSCLSMNKIISEQPFEIQGDLTLSSDHHGMQRSRQSILPNNLPKTFLFENFSIMLKCNGCQEMVNNDELIELIKLSGAKYTTDSYISRLQTDSTRIVLCEKEYLINRKEIYDKCIHIGVHFLTPEWFLESLVQYRIQPFQDYQISP
ncbi:unnamed protein product [Rotaria sordida]|uniref:Uncharacterized protein n=1 Tax=Rotaria sordida TaxID=392033 RepID=A0A814C5A7_9BILA|nr:unnamed protein product [Rotaria sordida]